MYKGRIATGTVLAQNVNIPLTTVLNTNRNTRYNSSDNSVEILTSGYYDIMASLPLTNASAGPITLQFYADGEPIAEAIATNDMTATTGVTTFTIIDTIQIIQSPLVTDYEKISLRLTTGTADLYSDGVVTIEQRK